jgi:hypothetical protein
MPSGVAYPLLFLCTFTGEVSERERERKPAGKQRRSLCLPLYAYITYGIAALKQSIGTQGNKDAAERTKENCIFTNPR